MAERNNPMAGLFGMTPDTAIQQRQAQDEASQILAGRIAANAGTMMSPSLAPLYAQAAQQGQMIGRGVAGLFGVEDPALVRAGQVQAATRAVQNMDIDLNDPKQLYPAMIQELQKRGLMDMALPLVKQYQDALAQESRMKYEGALAEKAGAEKYEMKIDPIFGGGYIFNPRTSEVRSLPTTPGSTPTPSKSPVVVPNTQRFIWKDGQLAPNPNYKP